MAHNFVLVAAANNENIHGIGDILFEFEFTTLNDLHAKMQQAAYLMSINMHNFPNIAQKEKCVFINTNNATGINTFIYVVR